MTSWASFFNLDYLFYLIHSFFRGIFVKEPSVDFNEIIQWRFPNDIIPPQDPSTFTLPDVTQVELESLTSESFGQGLGSLYDGYSLFRPPHGLSSFDGFSGWWHNFTTNPYCDECSSFADLFFGDFNAIFWFFIIIFVLGVLWLRFQLKETERIGNMKYATVRRQEKETPAEPNSKGQRWEEALKLSQSENVNDHKAAIIEADNLLEETLREQGHLGSTVGEMLKTAKFKTKQNAWAAHHIRNQIAHEPNFILTPAETKRVMQNYAKVFGEFYYL